MMTVKEVSRRTGVSIRTLQYYDRIGLLKPSRYTDAGYRLYDGDALAQLQQILLYRELTFPLKDIRKILSSPHYDRKIALEQQLRLLELKREHIENLITLAREINEQGEYIMDFSAFDKRKQARYTREAKEAWGGTDAYQEFAEKSKDRSQETEKALGQGLMAVFAEMGSIKDTDPAGPDAQALVKKLQGYITEHYYNCTEQILLSLGQMYAAGGEFTGNIDAAGGEGTGAFAWAAIKAACGK